MTVEGFIVASLAVFVLAFCYMGSHMEPKA